MVAPELTCLTSQGAKRSPKKHQGDEYRLARPVQLYCTVLGSRKLPCGWGVKDFGDGDASRHTSRETNACGRHSLRLGLGESLLDFPESCYSCLKLVFEL